MIELVKLIWETEQILTEWVRAGIHPIHKKGGKMLRETIVLLDTCYKVPNRILRKRMNNEHSENILGNAKLDFEIIEQRQILMLKGF